MPAMIVVDSCVSSCKARTTSSCIAGVGSGAEVTFWTAFDVAGDFVEPVGVAGACDGDDAGAASDTDAGDDLLCYLRSINLRFFRYKGNFER